MPPKIVIYGQPGVGKSSWSASAPKPVFIPTEDGLNEIDTAKFPLCKSYEEVIDCLRTLCTEEHDFKTVCLDSADWLEPLIFARVCEDFGVKTIEKADGGYGRGYLRAAEKWDEILGALNWLRNHKGMTSIIIAHSKVTRFEDPENPAYDRYTLRLNDKAADRIVQWADCVFFATKEMHIATDTSGRSIAQAMGANGGNRILRTISSPSCTAKNRYNLPEKIELSWDAFCAEYAKNEARFAKPQENETEKENN